MTLRNARPLRFSPAGLSDTLAEEDAFPGACAILTNLIPEPSTKNVWTPRPASILSTSFPGFNAPTGVPLFKVVGEYVFGFVSTSRNKGAITGVHITNGGTGYTNGTFPNTALTGGSGTGATGTITVAAGIVTAVVIDLPGVNYVVGDALAYSGGGGSNLAIGVTAIAGFDEPFCYNLVTKSFVTVTGITAANVPITQPTVGDWTPPTMDVTGVDLVVTHPGFDGSTNFFGWFDITNLQVPIWNAGNFSLVTPMATVSIITGGTGYTNGAYQNVSIIGGTGGGATVNITVAGGIVTALSVASGGVGYAVGNTFTVSTNIIGGAGSGFQGAVATVIGNAIGSVNITGTGTGYTTGTYTNVPLGGGSGSGAQATIVVNASNVVNSVTITSPGGGYIVGDTLGISAGAILTFSALTAGSGYTNGTYVNVPLIGGTGQGATANFTVAGNIVTVCTLNNGGFGYVHADSLSVVGGSGVVGSLTEGGSTSINLSGTYNNIALTTQTGSGTGCIANLTVGTISPGLYGVTSATIVNGGSGYALGDNLNFKVPGHPTTTLVVVVATLATVSAPLGPGTGFKIPVNTVSANPIGAGSGFTVQVATVLNPGGYIDFTTIPSWVRQFNGRSWFGINPPTGTPSVIYSDVYALNCTNANQSLSFGDDITLTAAAPLPLSNVLGGIV